MFAATLVLTTGSGLARAAAAQADGQEIVCESKKAVFTSCPIRTPGRVRLVENLSTARCEYGRTWGFGAESIWVDQGCRGRFRVVGNPTPAPVPAAAPNIQARARTACEDKAKAAGYSAVQVVGTAPSGRDVTVRLRGSDRGQLTDMVCTYRTSTNTAVMTQQGVVSPGNRPVDSALLGRARAACEAAAKQQGYEVLGSGPSEATPNGVRHALSLRRGTAAYPAASCNYLTVSGRAVLTPGVPTTGARPR